MANANELYQAITLFITNAVPGQKIAVQVTANGAPIGFSSGPPLQDTQGISLQAQSGSVPLSLFSLTSSQVAFYTSSSASGGGTLTFSLQLYLVADQEIETFSLSTQADPGVVVTAGFPGGMQQTVSASPTLFTWPS